jgi:predicted transporter
MRLIVGSILIVFFSQLIGQLIPPFSILVGTTVLIPVAVCFINFSDRPIFGIGVKKDLPVILRIILVYLCVAISFTLDFLYSPGTKDSEGDALVSLSSFAGLIVSGVILIRFQMKEKEIKMTKINIGQIILIVAVPLSWIILNRFGTYNILYEVFV